MKNKFERFKDVMTEGFLYEFLWKRNFLTKIIYILIPFVLIGSFALIIYFRDAYHMDKGYYFLADYTNCYMLCYIFFFMYFVYGLFVPYLSHRVKEFSEKVPIEISEKYNKNARMAKCILSFSSVIISGFAIPFIYVASKAGDMNWYSKLTDVQILYYSFLIVCAWIMSVKLFVSIVIESVTLYKYLNCTIKELDFFNRDKQFGLKGLYAGLVASMGFGIYILIAVGVILYSDYNAYLNFNLELLAYKYAWIIVILTVTIEVLYYAILIITFISLRKKLNYLLKEELQNYELDSYEAEFLRSISTNPINMNNFLIFVLSVLFPGISALVQIFISIV